MRCLIVCTVNHLNHQWNNVNVTEFVVFVSLHQCVCMIQAKWS